MLSLDRYNRISKKVRLLGFSQSVNYYINRFLFKDKIVKVRVPEISTPLLMRPIDSDIDVLVQVFIDRDCDISLNYKPRLIIDAGAYIGYTTLFFATKFSGSKVVAVEPDLQNYDLLCRNCSQYSNIFPIRGAIWDSNAALKIFNPWSKSWTIRVSEIDDPSIESIRGITILDLLNEFKATEIDILKIDIEGSEEKIFSSKHTDWINAVKTMIIEVHGKKCEEAILRAISEHNFQVTKKGEKLILTRRQFI